MPERNVTVRLSVQANTQGVDTYKEKMAEAKTSTDNMKTSADNTSTGMSQLGDDIRSAFTVATALKVAQMAGQFVTLGVRVGASRLRFQELTESMGGYEEIMDRLRSATLGQASDTDIQTGANLLLQMGIAESPEELETMLELITRLKQPTEDLNSAINNFSLMLANQSIQRLDSFGISSGKVRDRINELLESGQALNREQAFKMATLELGAIAVERLGASAEVANTSIGRLRTQVTNAAEDFAARAASGAEGFGLAAEVLLGIHPAQQEAAKREAEGLAQDVTDVMQRVMTRSDLTLDQGTVTEYIANVRQALQDNPELQNNVVELRMTALTQMVGMRPGEGAFAPGGGLEGLDTEFDMIAQTLVDVRNTREATAAEEERAAAMQAANEQRQQAIDLMRQQEEADQRRLQAGRLIADVDSMNAQAIQEAFKFFQGSSFEDSLPDLMTREQADNIGAMADEAANMADEMERLAELNPEMFTENDIENAKATADQMKDLATEAEKAADAFEKIKLSEVFGQTGGGLTGEVGDQVLQAARDRGASEEELARLQREMDLASGRETTGSIFLQEDLAPMVATIAAEQGPEVAAGVTTALAQALAMAALQGIDTNSPEFLAALQDTVMQNAEGFDPAAFVASQSGDTTPAEDAQTVSEATSTTAENMTSVSEDTAALTESMEPVKTGFDDMATSSERMSSAVQGVSNDFNALGEHIRRVKNELVLISGRQWKLRFDVEAIGNGLGVIDFFNRNGITNAIQREVSDVGGTVPGTNTNVGLS